jgi:hypothetical protein
MYIPFYRRWSAFIETPYYSLSKVYGTKKKDISHILDKVIQENFDKKAIYI